MINKEEKVKKMIGLMIVIMVSMVMGQLNGTVIAERPYIYNGIYPNGYYTKKVCHIKYDYTKAISTIIDEIDTAVEKGDIAQYTEWRSWKMDTIFSPIGPLTGGVNLPDVNITTLFNDTLKAWYSSPSYLKCVWENIPYNSITKTQKGDVDYIFNGISYHIMIEAMFSSVPDDSFLPYGGFVWEFKIFLTDSIYYIYNQFFPKGYSMCHSLPLYTFRYTATALPGYPAFSSVKIYPYKIVNNRIENKNNIIIDIMGRKISNRLNIKNAIIKNCYFILR
jgi:hypothetical protein